MSTCSFSSYLSMRASPFAASCAPADVPVSAAAGPTAALAPSPVHHHHHHPHPFEHVAPSPTLSDVGSPFKRQRNRSPDSSAMTAAVAASTLPTPVDDAEAQVVPAAAAASYFAAFHQPLYQRPPPPSGLQPPAPASPTSPAHSPLLAAAPKSILCVPSSPLRYAPELAPCIRGQLLTLGLLLLLQHGLLFSLYITAHLSTDLASLVHIKSGPVRAVYQRQRVADALDRRVRSVADRADVRIGEPRDQAVQVGG